MSSRKKKSSVLGSSPQNPMLSKRTTSSKKNISKQSQLQSLKKLHIYDPPWRSGNINPDFSFQHIIRSDVPNVKRVNNSFRIHII